MSCRGRAGLDGCPTAALVEERARLALIGVMERKAVGPSHAFYRTILAMLDGLVCGQSGLRLQPYLLYWLCEVSKNQPLHKTTVLCPGSTSVGCPGVTNDLGDLYAESGQTLQGSFSAVSKPNFASKYAFESSRRHLHNALLCTALKSYFLNFFSKKR